MCLQVNNDIEKLVSSAAQVRQNVTVMNILRELMIIINNLRQVRGGAGGRGKGMALMTIEVAGHI